MKTLMIHDVRDIDKNFFPNRYAEPYFFTLSQFKDILKKFPPKSYNDINSKKGYIYTFDDGLLDHLHVARLMSKINIKCIFFIPKAPITDGYVIDSHKIQFLLSAIDNSVLAEDLNNYLLDKFSLEEDFINSFRTSRWKNNIWSDEKVFITRIFREYGEKKIRDNLLDHFFKKYLGDDQDIREKFYLNISDVEEISQLGHLIGGHGDLSFDLRFSDADDIEREISSSNDFISKFNSNDKRYAFANGGYNKKAIELLRKYEFQKSYLTDFDGDQINDEEFLIRRLEPSRYI